MKTFTRWAIKRDLPAVLEIEGASYTTGTVWTREDFLAVLKCRQCIMIVAEQGNAVVGFAVYELQQDRLRVLNLAVAPHARRSGVGAKLLRVVMDKVTTHRRERLTATIRETNANAIAFARACGLRATGLERGAFEVEDGYTFTYRPDAETWAPYGGEPINRIKQRATAE